MCIKINIVVLKIFIIHYNRTIGFLTIFPSIFQPLDTVYFIFCPFLAFSYTVSCNYGSKVEFYYGLKNLMPCFCKAETRSLCIKLNPSNNSGEVFSNEQFFNKFYYNFINFSKNSLDIYFLNFFICLF